MLSEDSIKRQAAMGSSYKKGCHYYAAGHVEDIEFIPDKNLFVAQVAGREIYDISIQFDEDNKIESYDCDCPAFYEYNGACKHIVAVLKTIKDDWDEYFPGQNNVILFPDRPTKQQLKPTVQLTRPAHEMLKFFTDSAESVAVEAALQPVRLTPTYAFAIASGHKQSSLKFSIGTERMYVVKHIPQLMEALENKNALYYGKNFTFEPLHMEFDKVSQPLVDILYQAYLEEQQRSNWSYYASYGSVFADARHYSLTNRTLRQFLKSMAEEPFDVEINDKKITGLTIEKGRPRINLTINNISGGVRLALNLAPGEVLYGLDAEFEYIYYQRKIYQVDAEFSRYIKPLLNCFSANRATTVDIPESNASDFFSGMLPALEKISRVELEAGVMAKYTRETLDKAVYLDKEASGMSARIEFHYGEKVLQPDSYSTQREIMTGDKLLLRSSVEEAQLLNLFRQYDFSWEAGRLVQLDEEKVYLFLQQGLSLLRDMAEVYYTDAFKNVRIYEGNSISAGVRLNTDTDMLELSLNYEEISLKELMELLSAYKIKKRYHRLQDGSFIPLDSQEFEVTAQLLTQLGVKSSDLQKKVIELPKYCALYLDSLARETEDFHMERSSAFKKMVQDIKEPQDIEYQVPAGIQGKLRGYQKTGFKWLKSLASYGFGGILADDMGLGKTLQVITFLLSEKTAESAPSLVIAPTSLVYNWQDEVQKFAPSLNMLVVSGQPEERAEQLQEMDKMDLVVTSYALIKRDIEFYEEKQFLYCFLDEAQHVKNPNTLSAKTVKKIRAKNYFALTGTPIENTLTELWSIFDFIMPGYLQNHKSFTSKFEQPIVKNGDKKALGELSRHIKPFIMRRMKKAVLKELPEKIESKLSCEMTKEQAKLYTAWVVQARADFESEIAANGFSKSQIKILALLTRLRQLCCHPALFIENYHGGSGKLEVLTEIVKEAVTAGHKILLFSQFTGMLALIKEKLAKLDVSYYYLDGSTAAEERMKLVHSFNAGAKDVFLISLKAGGTGLNLTGADTVIHFDPWWNPAVEDQATDRAYRIGQKNAVQVYKFIAKNTIEEKIYELQKKKQEMIDSLIKPGENFLTKLSEDEIRKLFAL
ncbi:MAG: DEAD/DEAH box helicase [Pelosinus sp.]|nr:DEAD/DEAH box helicase [Pelosinus sp.]